MARSDSDSDEIVFNDRDEEFDDDEFVEDFGNFDVHDKASWGGQPAGEHTQHTQEPDVISEYIDDEVTVNMNKDGGLQSTSDTRKPRFSNTYILGDIEFNERESDEEDEDEDSDFESFDEVAVGDDMVFNFRGGNDYSGYKSGPDEDDGLSDLDDNDIEKALRLDEEMTINLPAYSEYGYDEKYMGMIQEKQKLAEYARLAMQGLSAPQRILPEVPLDAVLQAFATAQSKLQLSAVPASLPCRDKEKADLTMSITSMINSGIGGCLYISGIPGTGKTATVHEVIHTLQATKEVQFSYNEINAMSLSDPLQLFPTLHKKLFSGPPVSVNVAQQKLEKRFVTKAKTLKKFCILMVDEFDYLTNSKKHRSDKRQNMLYSLFDWASNINARLIVITISNTMNLPESLLPRVSSRMGIKRHNFAPYSKQQLVQIVTSRISDLGVFNNTAIEFIATKVASVSGDARRALSICSKAVDVAVQEYKNRDADCNFNTYGLIEVRHVLDAVDAEASVGVMILQGAALHEKLFMCAVLLENRFSGIPETTFGKVCTRHKIICNRVNVKIPSPPQVAAICARLAGAKLLRVEDAKMGVLQRMSLNLSIDDLIFAIGNDEFIKDVL